MAAIVTTIIIPKSTPNDVFLIFDFFISSCIVSLGTSAETVGTARYPIAPHRTMIKVDVRSVTRLFRDFVFIYIMNEKFLYSPRPASCS